MLGNKKTNIEFVNNLFETPNKVNFVQIEESAIGTLMDLLKGFKRTIKQEYEHDIRLQQDADEFIKTLQRIVGILRDYSTYVRANQAELFEFVKSVKTPNYIDLYEQHISPIMKVLKDLLPEYRNGYVEKIEQIIKNEDDVYVITRHKMHDTTFQFKEFELPVMREKEFIELGIYVKHLIFIGTPSYFPQKFSEIFYADQTTFLGYSCFENKIQHKKAFSKLVKSDLLINTFYKNVKLDRGFSGMDYKIEIEKPLEKLTTEQFLKAAESRSQGSDNDQGILVVAAYISNNHFLFIPVNQNVNILERETFKVSQARIKEMKVGDLLIFRSQNGADLIREVADEIIGENAQKLRKNLSIWKSKLIANIEKKDLERISQILRNKYKIKSATENNIKNWINPYSIKPNSLEQLLMALKFDDKSRKIIQSSANTIMSAHISAGHMISKGLMEEINANIENIIDENGYYKFDSKIFKGASFNIEEIQKLSTETFNVQESDVLKIFSI